MSAEQSGGVRADVFAMLVSAGIFAYFGFSFSWAHQYTSASPPQLLPMVVLLKWALRGGAVAFGASALLAMAGQSAGALLYGAAGVITGVIFVIVAVWDWSTPQYFSGVAPILLLILGAWNGYGAWAGLRVVMAQRAARAPRDTFPPPP